MRKILSVFIFLVISIFVLSQPVMAQTPTDTSTSSSPTCDICGYCVGSTKPSNWDSCYTCVYDDTGAVKPGTYWTVAGCFSTKPELFVKSILNVVFAVSGGLAFLAFIAGSAMILLSSGDPERLNNGKSIVISSVFGLLLILFSVFLLRFVGVDVLKIPGFG